MTDWHAPNQQAVGVDPAATPKPVPEKATAAAPSSKPAPQVAAFDPGEHTAADVIAYVGEHPDERRAVLKAEKAGKARVTVVEALSS